MKINKEGIDLIKHYESLHDGDLSAIGLQPKQDCIGIWTVGYGHACASKDIAFSKFDTLTVQEAEDLLRADLESFSKGVTRLLSVVLNDNQFSAVVSFAYNCGLGNLKSSTLLKHINANKFTLASAEFAKWNKASGKVFKGLILRRESERALFVKEITNVVT